MYNNFYKFIPESVLSIDFTGRIIDASQKSLEVLGFESVPELIGNKLKDFFELKDQKIVLKMINDTIETNEVSSNSLNLIKHNGEVINLEVIIGMMYDNASQKEALIVVLHDIDIYHKRIKHSHYLLDYVINHSKSGVAIHDRNMNYLYVSKRYLEQYNIHDRNIIGKNHYDVFPDLPDRWKEVHKRALQGEIFSEDRDPFVREDKSVNWTRWECRPWYDYDNSIGGIIIYTEVINSQVELEEQLYDKINEVQNQKERMEIILNTVEEAVISTDVEGRISYVNDEAAKLLGVKKNTIIGKSYFDLVNLYDARTNKKVPSALEIVRKTHQKTQLTEPTVLISNNQTRYYIESKAAPLRTTKGELYGLVSFFKDITEQKQKEEAVEFFSTHDPMTGLFNRRYVNEELMRIDNEKFYPIGLLLMDINGLKLINDAYGYDKGDEVIRAVAMILKEICANKYTLARPSGGEFSILLTNTSLHQLDQLKNHIKSAIAMYRLHNIEISLSIGYSIRDNRSTYVTNFISEAENNMYKNKIVDGKSIRNNAIKAILETLTDKYKEELVHSQRVSYYCKKMGEVLNLSTDEIKELEMAGMYHDIGKISIPDAILGKPTSLTADEYEIMKTHTSAGYQILKAADAYSNLAEYVLSHHERWDGSGYPNNLKAKAIPLFSRIISIADAYEAMTTNRVYKKKISKIEAAKELIRCAGTQFDSRLTRVFVEKILKVNVD